MAELNDLGTSPGFISGTAIIRDKDGNVKGELVLGCLLTAEQSQAMDNAIAEQKMKSAASVSSLTQKDI